MNTTANPFDFWEDSQRQKAGKDSSPLIYLSPEDAFTMKHSFEGILILGEAGSGKTSGDGRKRPNKKRPGRKKKGVM